MPNNSASDVVGVLAKLVLPPAPRVGTEKSWVLKSVKPLSIAIWVASLLSKEPPKALLLMLSKSSNSFIKLTLCPLLPPVSPPEDAPLKLVLAGLKSAPLPREKSSKLKSSNWGLPPVKGPLLCSQFSLA